jgi:hypothetical protein
VLHLYSPDPLDDQAADKRSRSEWFVGHSDITPSLADNVRIARYPPGTLEPLLKCEPKDLSEEEFYSIRRVIIGSRRDTRHAGRAQARMATASSAEVTMR